jgi:hypothetical protein
LVSSLLAAATPLLINKIALLHTINSHILAPLAAMFLARGAVKPRAFARVIAGAAFLDLGMRVGNNTGGEGHNIEDD